MALELVENVTLLFLAIVQEEDAGGLIDELVERGHRATRIDSSGGFLFQNNAVLLVGTDERRVDDILDAITQRCETRVAWAPSMPVGDPLVGIAIPIKVEVGGAVIFVLEVERCVRLVGTARREMVRSAANRP